MYMFIYIYICITYLIAYAHDMGWAHAVPGPQPTGPLFGGTGASEGPGHGTHGGARARLMAWA